MHRGARKAGIVTNCRDRPEEPLAGESGAPDPALLHGFLTEVDRGARTASLREPGGDTVDLSYGPALDGDVRRLEERTSPSGAAAGSGATGAGSACAP